MSFGLDSFRAASVELDLALREGTGLVKRDAHALEGVLDGQRVSIRQVHGEFTLVDFEAFFDPPADLQLLLAPEGVVSKVKALFGGRDIQVGDPEFDAAFQIRAHEPERARALFGPELRKMLMPWRAAGNTFRVDDHGIYLSLTAGTYYTPPAAELLVQNGRALAALARAFSAAFETLPPARALAPHVDAWRAFAEARALEFRPSPLRITGALPRASYRGEGGVPFVARAVPIGDDFGVELRVRIEPRPEFLLRVRPVHWYDFAERHHVGTGDAAFDRTFRVTSDAPDAALQLLNGDVRAALVALHGEQAGVSLEDGELAIRTEHMIEPTAFPALVDRLADAARAFGNR